MWYRAEWNRLRRDVELGVVWVLVPVQRVTTPQVSSCLSKCVVAIESTGRPQSFTRAERTASGHERTPAPGRFGL
eukprot:33692-Eustigmatos_ZCMA.PRE.1